MAYGPHAVTRDAGKVLFVRGAAPQERVEVAVREEHDRFAFADVVSVLQPSPARRVPPCEYLPHCGGCPWQHLDPGAQRAAKRQIVAEQLRRLGGLEVAVEPVLAAPREFGYRRRVKLRVANGAIGYHAAASHAIVPVGHCLLAEPPVDAAMAALPDLLAGARSAIRRLEIVNGGSGGGVVVVGEVEGPFEAADEAHATAWLEGFAAVSGLVLRGRKWERTWGDPLVALSTSDASPLKVHAAGFTQVNSAANQLLVDTVLRLADPHPGQRILDLYAGAGNLSLPLRRAGAEVTAVERDARATRDARRNAEAEPGPPLQAIAQRAERAVAQLAAAGERFDVVILDPPRSGAQACIEALRALGVPRLIYVSCDPATLARDLRALVPPYAVDVVQPIDMFPQTYHVEIVLRAALACEPADPIVSSPRRRGSVRRLRRRRT
ncbi:MAG: 23S rRNA (uracil(1939)-C(5))-methyltransferase RlmD [Candidatus Binatia bacterium]